MLSLTYEFWAIFQNFSQGGYLHLHLQGLGGMQPGSQGWCLSASNEQPVDTKKYLLLHATFISVLGLFGLEGLPVVVLVSIFVFFLLLATYCKFSLTQAYYSCALIKTCLRLCAVSWLRLRRVVNDMPQRFLIDEVLSSSGLGLQGGSGRRLGGQHDLKSNTTHLRASLHLLMLHFNASLNQRGPGSPARPGKLFRIFSLRRLVRLTMYTSTWLGPLCFFNMLGR